MLETPDIPCSNARPCGGLFLPPGLSQGSELWRPGPPAIKKPPLGAALSALLFPFGQNLQHFCRRTRSDNGGTLFGALEEETDLGQELKMRAGLIRGR